MKQLNPDRLRNNLNTVIHDVEQILLNMSDATGEQVGELKSRAGSQLHDARDRLGRMERRTAAQLLRAKRQAQGYVHDHPWKVVGGLAAIAMAVAVLTRTRH